LRRRLADAERHGRIHRNVASLARGPKAKPTKIDDSLDAAEAATVLQAASGDRLEAIAVLALTTGMRQGEIIALRWDAIDLDAATVTVRRSTTKTEAGERTIALPPMAVAALRRHRARQAEERLAAPVWDDPEIVFTDEIGRRLNRTAVLRWWHRLTINAGVGRRRFHASRHTAATLMLNSGVRLEVVSKTLGHAGLAITADVYAKVRPELQRTAADAMQNLLGTGTDR
jgi:integrase